MKLFRRHNQETPPERQSSFVRTTLAASELRQKYTFKRGRTLTGSSSPEIYSTNEAQADLKSSRVHTHLLVKQRRRLGLLMLLCVVVASVFFFLVYQFTASAVVRASPDPSLRLDERYGDLIETYLSDRPAQRWRFALNMDGLTSYLMTAAPEVKTIEANGFSGIGASMFLVTVREPVASWDVNGRQLYVDEDGTPFSRNYFTTPSLTVTDRSGIPFSDGQSIASNRFMGFVGQVIGRTNTYGHEVAGITIPPGMTRQIEVRLRNVSYPIKLSSDRKAGEGVEDMIKAVEWMRQRSVTPEYIDVRVKGKVFYK